MVKNTSDGSCKLFVGGLSHDTTDSSLLAYFESFGKVISAIVLRDPETLSSRGFGFVSFSSKREAMNCLSFGNAVIDNKEVEVKMAKPRPTYLNNETIEISSRSPRSSGDAATASSSAQIKLDLKNHPESDFIQSKVFVGGLLYSTGADSLKSYFSRFGEIASAEIIYNKETKISRGFGFVQFKDLESALSVIKFQSEIERHKIDGKKVEVKRCLKKSDNQSVNNPSKVSRNVSESKKNPSPVSLVRTSTTSKTFSFAEAAKVGIRQHSSVNRPTDTIINTGRSQGEFDFLGEFDELKLSPEGQEGLLNVSIGSNIWDSSEANNREFSNLGLFQEQSENNTFLDSSLLKESGGSIQASDRGERYRDVKVQSKGTYVDNLGRSSNSRGSDSHYLDSSYAWNY